MIALLVPTACVNAEGVKTALLLFAKPLFFSLQAFSIITWVVWCVFSSSCDLKLETWFVSMFFYLEPGCDPFPLKKYLGTEREGQI